MRALDFVIEALPYIAPMLLVYLVGVVLSCVYIKRSAIPAAFTLVGCGLLGLITLAEPFIQGYFYISGEQRTLSHWQIRQWMFVVRIIQTLLNVTAFSFLFSAIFIGRRSAMGSVYAPQTAVPGSSSGSSQTLRDAVVPCRSVSRKPDRSLRQTGDHRHRSILARHRARTHAVRHGGIKDPRQVRCRHPNWRCR